MKIHELRARVSSLARNQMTAEQTNQALTELVRGLDQLENAWQGEISRLHRQFRWLSVAAATAALALALTCSWLCWQGHQLRRQWAQSEARLAEHQEQLSRQEQRQALYSDALLKVLKRMTSQPPSQATRP